jgi:iron uptake system component EfeO
MRFIVRTPAAVAAATAGLLLAACGSSSSHSSGSTAAAGGDATVAISLTRAGCRPEPAKVSAGHVQFDVRNSDASAVSEAELRSGDLSHILGEQENLTPGLSGGFGLNIQPGTYKINCPGASQPYWTLTVTGRATGPAWQSNADLAGAVAGYATYINTNVSGLITHTRAFCRAIGSGDLHRAELLYSPARGYYERIEPVAEIWGSLDTEIDGRWENPVTVRSQFMGFHRIEQLIWADGTLAGAPKLCRGLVEHEKQLQTLAASAQYSPLEMAAGATDLVNEAATAKISGEEERYSNVDLPTFRANIDGALEVFTLLKPYLQAHDATTVTLVNQRHTGVVHALAPLTASPGYLDTGYVEYSQVLDSQRRPLSAAVNALAEALSKISAEVT